FNFGLILLISAALMLSGCAKEEDSSTSTAESGGGDTVAQVVTALQGAVKTFGSASSSRSSAASGTSINVDQGVKSLVSLYLMIDTDYKYPVAKVKSAEDGSYEISSDDIKDFLINPPTSGLDTDYGYVLPDDATGITSSSSASAIKTAFQALGPLTVRALYVKDGKAKAITAMADPTSTEAVRVDPIVSKVATQIIGKLVETIKATINSISGLGDSLKKTLLANVLSAVKDTVVSTLESVKDTTVFELPEGTDASTVADPESLLEVEMDSSTLAELNTQIESSDETVTIDTTSIAVADTGKLADTLTDAEKGALEKKADETSASASTAVAAQDASAGKKIKVAGLQKYFLALGFPVILDQQSDNTTVVAVPLKVPSDVDEGDLPGKSTFGDRSIRHFLVKGSSSSSAPSSGDFSSATELSSGITSLTTALSSYMMSDNASIVDDRKLDNASKSLLSRLRTFHRLNKTMKEGLPLVSKELVEWMAENDNATVPLKDVATQIAKLTEWRQERIVFSNGIPVFTGKMLKPKSGATVKATDLITALTMQMGANASSTAAKLTDENKSFWAPFAGPALADEVMRKASSFKGASQQSVESEMGKIIPKTESDYLTFLRGGTYTAFDNSTVTVPPSPGYMDAKASIAKGLVLALPDDAYGESNTLNGETKLSGKASVFLVNYMLNIMYPVDRAQGMLSTENTTGMVLPQIENFKQLEFTSDPSVSEIAGAIMGVTAPTDNVTRAFSESRMRSGALMDLSSLQLAEFREFDADAIGLDSEDNVDLQCTVKFYDGDDGTGDNKWNDFTATLLKVDQTTGDFEATTLGSNSDGTLSTNGSGASRAYSISGVPTNQEYLIRFKMKTYTNDLPDIFVYVDGFEANMNVCGEEGFVIGPDIEDKPVPGMGLMAGTSKTDSEGIDFSNYSIPGALTLIFQEDENSGRGTRDLMLTKSGSTFTLLAGDNMSFDLQNESGIHSLLGQSLTTRISGFSEEDITICSSGCTITPGTYGGLDDKLVILKVSASEYWLLELRFLDTNFGFLDFGFAKITAQGRAEFPDAGFEKGPVDVAKASVVQHSYLMFGDGYKLSDNSMQFAFNMDGNVNTSMGSDFRYAGKYFKQKISSMSDMDSNNFWQDSSNIPVRIDGTSKNSNGEVNIRFRKFTYKKSNRTYELDNTSSTSATDLDHNDLLAVFPN
ncbi:MAG: hypothetical protein VW879_08295, partial [Opitutae bacterium]